MIYDMPQNKTFTPHLAIIKASLVGSFMTISAATILGLGALGMFIFEDQPGAYLPVSIGILTFTLMVCVAIAYAPWRCIDQTLAIAVW